MICFDAVDTLICPTPAVAIAYHSVARNNGCCLTVSDIESRFKQAFQAIFMDRASFYECVSSEIIERQKWRTVVQRVFQQQYSDALFEDLWSHFAQPKNWTVIPEVTKVMSQLIDQGFDVGIASNFDRRIVPLIQFHFPKIEQRLVFYSTELGYAKPDVRFYKRIEKRLADIGKEKLQHQCLMIGDTFSNDYEAARRAGWNAMLIDSGQLDTAICKRLLVHQGDLTDRMRISRNV